MLRDEILHVRVRRLSPVLGEATGTATLRGAVCLTLGMFCGMFSGVGWVATDVCWIVDPGMPSRDRLLRLADRAFF